MRQMLNKRVWNEGVVLGDLCELQCTARSSGIILNVAKQSSYQRYYGKLHISPQRALFLVSSHQTGSIGPGSQWASINI